jgi:hypothetical protein
MRCQLVDANFHSFTGTAPAIKHLRCTGGIQLRAANLERCRP